MKQSLSCCNLSVLVKGRAILNSVSVEVSRGAATVLLGPSGAGKTTLISALSLLLSPSKGSVTVDGTEYTSKQDIKRKPPWPKVTVVFQQHFLWPHLSLRHNIMVPIRKHEHVSETVTAVMTMLNLDSCQNRLPSEVSMGERQRAALARALVLKPCYLLLDEVTASLDVENTSTVLNAVIAARDQGVGIVAATHHLGFAEALLADLPKSHLAFLDEGRVVEAGGHSTLLQPQTDRLSSFMAAGRRWRA